MRLRSSAVLAFVLTAAGYGCSKSDATTVAPAETKSAEAPSNTKNEAPANTKNEAPADTADMKNAGAKGAFVGKGAPVSAKAAEERLTKAGWTVESGKDLNENWPSRYLKITKGPEDQQRSATVWIEGFAEAVEGAPKPVLTMGEGTLIRFGWEPAMDKKTVPNLARYAKDVAAFCPPEKATDELFQHAKFSEAVDKWGLTDDGYRGGGRLLHDVVYNHRFLGGDAGTLAIEIVFYKSGIAKGQARLLGTTLVSVEADDEATTKELYGVLGGD